MNIGNVIKRNRLKKGITQKQLANYLGVKVSTISRYEKGLMEIPSSVLFCICEYLEFSPNEFIHGKRENKNSNENNRVILKKSCKDMTLNLSLKLNIMILVYTYFTMIFNSKFGSLKYIQLFEII